MGFILGLLIGLLVAIGLFGTLLFWLCSRSDSMAVSKLMNGIAKALAHKPELSDPFEPGDNGPPMGVPGERAKKRQGSDKP